MENPSNLQYLILIVLSIICGLGVRASLEFANQRWAMTYHHTMSYALLPPVTMVITTLIAGNIALSLGMIGALSIVRFRNPVKNPFELIIFFALITVGIGIAVNVKLGLAITFTVILVIILAKFYDNFSEKKGKKIFSLSFEEGSTVHILEVKSKVKIDSLAESKNLVQVYQSKDPKYFNYRLIFQEKEEVNKIKSQIENKEGIENIEIRYAS